MVIAYRVPQLTYWMMRRRALIQDIGLPNILLGSRVVPELIQSQAEAHALAAAVREWLDHPADAERVRERFTELHHDLRRGAAQQIADILLSELEHAGGR
jgi:lipid-A-disaccharide synthase